MATQTKDVTRIDILAQPKPFHYNYLEQRRSVYWIDRVPFASGPNGTTQIVATPRVHELSQPRSVSASYKKHRPTAMWPIRQSTLKREPTERLIALSAPRRPMAAPDRTVYSSVPQGLVRQETLDRLLLLSQPRIRHDNFAVNDVYWGQPDPVSLAAQTANPSSRIDDLSRPKQYHSDFQGERPVQTVVPEHALTSIANQHLQKLARPRARTMIVDDYDPYKVSPAAMRNKPTARTELLAAPPMRKQKQKRTGN